jgi:glutamate synthase domain-containing protein 3
MTKASELNPVISYMESIGSTWALFYISGNMDKTIDRFLDAELAEPPETRTGIATESMQQKLVELINEHYVQPNQARLLNIVEQWRSNNPDWRNIGESDEYENRLNVDWLSYRLEISLMDMKRAYVTAQYKVADDDTPYTDTEFLSTFNDPGATFWYSVKEESQ